MGLVNTKPHPHAVINAHPITWSPYAKFQPDWSINEFLVGIMMSLECGNDQTTPIDTDIRLIMLTLLLGNLISNFSQVGHWISY